MGLSVDYYFAPASPWTYLGHQRFADLIQGSGAALRLLPIDLAEVFPVSGGLPLGKRAPQRQAYRLLELARFRDHLKLPLNLKPKFFPVSGDDAARLILAVDQSDGVEPAMRLAGAVLRAVWAEERNIAEASVLGELLAESDLDAKLLEQSRLPSIQKSYEACTQAAIDAGVFGSPSFVVDGELYWGQDRLDFVERRLRTAPAAGSD